MIKQVFPIVICLFILILFTIKQVEGSAVKEIEEIIKVAEENEITITSWKGYFKSSLGEAKTINDIKDIVESTKDIFPFVKEWTDYNEQNHHFTVEGKTGKTNRIVKRIQIYAYNNNGIYNLFLTIETQENSWNEETATSAVTQIKTYLDEEEEYYTVEGFVNTKIDQTRFSKNLIKDLNVDFVEGISEEDFVSISGYKSEWESNIISSNGQEINFQLGMRYNPSKNITNITIGTPIIFKEY